MNFDSLLKSFLARRHRRSGVALVIILFALVLLVGLIVGFLSRVGTERISASSYGATISVRQLADTAVNVVQGQINEATSNANCAWASQPGAVRVYDDSGSLRQFYRLYSSRVLTSSTSAIKPSDEEPETQWASKPAVWVDLNAPALSSGSGANLVFPILDCRNPSDTSTGLNLDGFSIDTTDKNLATPTQVHMPVRWLYVLQDGSIVAPSSDTGTSVRFDGVVVPSGTNPIVGRIAFWTDDDTCKVNVNTAGGDGKITSSGSGTSAADKTFWTTPRFCSPDDLNFANYSPAKGEYQRYPGHPATVALNSILSSLSGASISSDDFYAITPRYANGGSKGATVLFNNSDVSIKNLPSSPLYPSVGELMFKTGVNAVSGTDRLTDPYFNRQKLEAARFFLTAHSRAPELNLYGKPRISMWPVYGNATDGTFAVNDNNHVTATDRLLAFCSSVQSGANNYPYYFTRYSAASPSKDIGFSRNSKLLDYLDTLTKTNIPGFGGSFYTKYGEKGSKQILTEIFDYIRTINMLDNNLPVTSGSFNYYAHTQDWGRGWNLGMGQVTPAYRSDWGTQGIGTFCKPMEVGLQFVCLGTGTTYSSGTAVSGTAVPTSMMSFYGSYVDSKINSSGMPPAQNSAIQAYVVATFSNPGAAYLSQYGYFYIEFENLDKITVNGTAIGFPSTSAALTTVGGHMGAPSTRGTYTGRQDFGFQGPLMLSSGGFDYGRTMGRNNVNNDPLFSNIFPVVSGTLVSGSTVALPYMHVEGPGSVNINIYAPAEGKRGKGELVQRITNVPVVTGSVPIPKLAQNPIIGTSGTNDRWIKVATLPSPAPGGSDQVLVENNDVVITAVLNSANGWGDTRMLGAQNVDGSFAFRMHPNTWPGTAGSGTAELSGSAVAYPDAVTSAMAQNLFYNYICHVPGSANPWGKLVKNAPYFFSETGNSSYPLVPSDVNGAYFKGGTVGDWDNGTSFYPDGPWINKTDEGSLPLSTANTTPYFQPNTNLTERESQSLAESYFSPNRQVPSPGILGSLPTGIDPSGKSPSPWQTLLFRPGPTGHPGSDSPEDHLWMDLFWMPVAEPYAMSEPFSSAGKINLNYQILPFSYVTRNTALRAVLAGVKIPKVAKSSADKYKVKYYGSAGVSGISSSYYPVDLNVSLQQWKTKFDSGEIFKSATEICDEYLVPSIPGLSYANADAFKQVWYGDDYALVGDNSRERPYADIYGRVTTKSNTYTVYFTVQALKNPSKDPSQWTEGQGAIIGEYRGSTALERYIDPNQSVTDFADGKNPAGNLESHYNWRVIENRRFSP